MGCAASLKASNFAKRRSYDDSNSGLTPPTWPNPVGDFWSHFAVYRMADVIPVEPSVDSRLSKCSEDRDKSDFLRVFLRTRELSPLSPRAPVEQVFAWLFVGAGRICALLSDQTKHKSSVK